MFRSNCLPDAKILGGSCSSGNFGKLCDLNRAMAWLTIPVISWFSECIIFRHHVRQDLSIFVPVHCPKITTCHATGQAQNLFVQLHSCVAQESCKLTSVRPNAAPLQTNLNLRSRISQSLGDQNSWWIWIRQKPTSNEVTMRKASFPRIGRLLEIHCLQEGWVIACMRD